MTYQEAIQFLYRLQWFGAKLGLETTRKLAALAGNPHQRLRFIHVAGTNGKGSTCAMLEAIYRAAGLRVGLFTSPHLVSFAERIQVNRQRISESDVARLVEALQPLLQHGWPRASDAAGQFMHPTLFEVVTVMALTYFAEQACDLIIWETGLGGRLDATNIVTPLSSMITNVQLDHQEWLGDSLEKIASEKAGIIKPRVPVLTAADNPEALVVIRARALELNAPLTLVGKEDAAQPPLDTISLPLAGSHQRLNAALAIATVRVLAGVIPVPDASIRAGLERVEWPGRLQLITLPSGNRLLLDGAHNVDGALTLAAELRNFSVGDKPVLILGLLRDKDCPAICRVLAPLAGRIYLTPVASQRTAAPDDLARACAEANPTARIETCASPAEALAAARDEPLTVITGSLYLVGEVLEHLHALGPAASRERALNEWATKPR